MQKLRINNDLFEIPSSWNELVKSQLLAIAENYKPGIAVTEFYLKVLLAITGLTVMKKRQILKNGIEYFALESKNKQYLVSAIDIAFICKNALQFIFTKIKDADGNECVALNPGPSKNIIDSIPKEFTGLEIYSPSSGLTNLLMDEYIHAITAYSWYRKTNNQNYLLRLIAILYRPKDPKYNPDDYTSKGDPREPFNSFLLDARIEKYKAIPENYQKAITIQFDGCMKFLAEKHPNVFDGTGSDKDDVFTGMMNLVNALADGDVTKKEQVRKSYLWDAMNTMEQAAIRKKEWDEKNGNQTQSII